MVLVALLAILGIGLSVSYFYTVPYNLGFLEFPTIMTLHVIPGAIFFGFAPFQFISKICFRWPSYITVGLEDFLSQSDWLSERQLCLSVYLFHFQDGGNG